MDRDRNLLFAIFALQHGLAKKDDVVAAMNAWVLEKHRPLADLLVERGAMKPAGRQMLDNLLDFHIAEHGSPQRSLAAVELSSSVCDALSQVADHDVQASVAALGVLRAASTVAPTPGPATDPPADDFTGFVAPPPAVGGRYHVLRSHAKGGLGEVFVATDLELRRKVALKEIQRDKAGHPAARGRFVVEAEVTGALEHPGIVPVYGLGRHPDGRPFYAMRFVKGDELKDAIARFHQQAEEKKQPPNYLSLPFRGLLRRFVDVCNAIAYAHSRGVLHRDLKPGNIMLGKYGETLVVDWGLAKTGVEDSVDPDEESVLPSDDSGSVETVAGQVMGTPAYMPPEQAEGRLDLLGPASDVYSLGATLWSLLAGKSPGQGLPKDELLKHVRGGSLASAREVQPAVPAALDAVCRKAMALRPADRYGSALDLAKEIEAWLADEPVSAWREPLAVQAKRWARKRPRLVAGTAAAVLVGLLATGLALAVVGRLNGQLASAVEAADKARDAAEGRLGEIKKANALLAGIFSDFQTQETDRATEDLSVRLGRRLKKTAEKLDADAIKDGETLADLQYVMAFSLWELGYLPEAIAIGKASLDWREASLGPRHPDTLNSRNAYAVALQAAGKLEAALPLLEATFKARQADLGPDHFDTLISSNNYAMALRAAGQLEKALPMLEATYKASERTLGKEDSYTLTRQTNFATALTDAGKHTEALPLLESALKAFEAKLGADHSQSLACRNNYASALFDVGRVDEALRLFAATMAACEAKLGADHPDTLVSRNNYANALKAAGKLKEAVSLSEATLKASEAKLGTDHPNTLTARHVHAMALWEFGELPRALPLLEANVKAYDSKLGAGHPETLFCRNDYARALYAAGKLEQALPQFEAALQGYERKFGAKHRSTHAVRSNYAEALRAIGKFDLALPLLAAALQDCEAELGPGHSQTVSTRNNYANALQAAGRLEEALPLFKASLDFSEAKMGAGHIDTLVSLNNYASALRRSGKAEQALPLFRRAWESAKSNLGIGHPDVLQHFEANFVRILGEMGQLAEQRQVLNARLAWWRQQPGSAAEIAATLIPLAACWTSEGKPSEAEPLLREALALRESVVSTKPPQALPWQVANTKSLLGGCLSAQKKFAEALPLLQAGYGGISKEELAIPADVRNQRFAEAAERLAQHYAAVGDAAKAKEWQAKAAAHRKPAGK